MESQRAVFINARSKNRNSNRLQEWNGTEIWK